MMQRGWKGAAVALAATMVLAGQALAQRGGGFGFGRMGGGANMLRMPEVQTELKLTDEQKTKVSTLLDKLQEQRQNLRDELQGLSQEERQKKLADMRTAEQKQVEEILTADQMKRYHQLELQQQGMTGVLQPEVASELKLTDDQKTKIQGIMDDMREQVRSLFQDNSGDRQAMMQKVQDLRKATDEKIAAVLTDDQKSKWKDMIGAPFTFPAFGGPGRRGAGA